jgi:hypothetical protein
MRNINILHYGKIKQVDVYESMFEYVKGSGTGECEKDYAEGQPEYFVEEWQAALDSEIYFGYDPMRDFGEIDIDVAAQVAETDLTVDAGRPELRRYTPVYSLGRRGRRQESRCDESRES